MDGGVTVNTISAKFSLENNDEFSVTTEFSLDMVKRKHIFIELRFCLEDGTGIKALQQDGSIAYSDAVGDIVVLVPVKRDVAEGKSLKITVPYNIFPELKPNTVVICKAALINRDETETCRQTEIKLLVNLGGRFVLYSDEKYTMYLKTTGTDQESVAWCESVISRDNIHDELLSAVLELLNELARAKNASDAQFMLYKLHSNKSLTVYNPSEAIKWLESSAANGYAEACDEIGKNGVVADILKNKDCVSAELYLKAAEEETPKRSLHYMSYTKTPTRKKEKAKA